MENWKEIMAKVLETEYCPEFDEKRKKALVMSFHKYGYMANNYGKGAEHPINAIETAKERIRLFEETGNAEFLAAGANQLMIEFKHPSHPNYHYAPKDSGASPGLIAKNGQRMK